MSFGSKRKCLPGIDLEMVERKGFEPSSKRRATVDSAEVLSCGA